MLYLIVSVFIVLSGLIFYRGRDIVIRPIMTKTDILGVFLVWLIFATFAYFINFDIVETLIMCLAVSVYFLAARYNRGFLVDGFVFQGNISFVNQKKSFSDLKQVNFSKEADQAVFTLVVNSNNVDTWRFPSERSGQILKNFKDNDVPVIYK